MLLNDVAERHDVRDIATLRRISRYLFENIGSIISANKIAGALTSMGCKTSRPTVDNYIRFLTDGRLFYEVERYDVRGKEHLRSLAKYYASDTGLRNYAVGFRGGDVGHVLENIVYLELVRRGFDVYVGVLPKGEIDFVVRKSSRMSYIQVSRTVDDERTRERELAPLRKVPDFAPKYLIGLDTLAPKDYDGIRYVNAIDWLLGHDDELR